jgi:hypothetical protein
MTEPAHHLTTLGNDDQVVPAHNKIIDFNKVDDTNFDMGGSLKRDDELPEEIDEVVLRVQNLP